MARYKLNNGVFEVIEKPEFETDKEAWDYLRKLLPNKFVTLYKEVEFEVFLNNSYGIKSGGRPDPCESSTNLMRIDHDTNNKVWIPILKGLSENEYNVEVFNK